jgi:hypothetical protein
MFADAARALRPFLADPADPSRAETGGRPPARHTGPVLMGDIHGARNGTPDLLLLWARWEADAPERDD